MEKICYAVVMSAKKLQHYFEAVKWHFQKLWFLGQDQKMGHWTIGACGRFWEEKCYQITSTSRLYCRLDGAIRLYRRHDSRNAVESILRWSLRSFWSWSYSDTEITIRQKIEVCGATAIYSRGRQVQQQHSQIVSSIVGPSQIVSNGVQHCILKTYSKVIASQIEKECTSRDETLERYLAAVRRMEKFFKGCNTPYYENPNQSH
jgi:hypothetical protein